MLPEPPDQVGQLRDASAENDARRSLSYSDVFDSSLGCRRMHNWFAAVD